MNLRVGYRAVSLIVALACTLEAPHAAFAQGAIALDDQRVRSKPPLAPLLRPPSRKLPAPTSEDVQALAALLQRVTDIRPPTVQAALDELLQVDASLLPAILQRLDQEADKSDRAKMKQLLLDLRGEAREAIDQVQKSQGTKGEVSTPDYLQMVLSYPRLEHPEFRRLVSVLALSRICVRLGTVEAVRVLIRVYVRFEFLRIDTQLQIQKLGDRALPALIETTHHQAPKVASWALSQLDFLGKAIPSEAVTAQDPQILADVLRAYGFNRDPDAARLVVSFANSERAQVRQAARQAITEYGEVANWQLRDAYEQLVGELPKRDWSWDRTAKELFREFDLVRLADLYRFYDEGLQAKQAGDLNKMRDAFDRVLTRAPDFDAPAEIAAGYLLFAEQAVSQELKPEDIQAVSAALERAARLAQDEAIRARARSLLLTVQAKETLLKGVADQLLVRRALQLDPANEFAKAMLAEIQREPLTETSSFFRTFWPALLGGLSLLLSAAVVVRRPWRQKRNPT